MPSSRLRVYQYLPLLREHGIEGTVLPALPDPWFSQVYYSKSRWIKFLHFGSEVLSAFGRAHRSRSYEVVVIQKGIALSNFRGLERFFVSGGTRVLFDLDDAVYHMNLVEFRWPLLRALQDPEQTAKLSSRCAAVIAGNRYLKSLALRYNPNVFVLPTPVDTDRICPERSRGGARREITIGWLGVPSGLAHFSLLRDALKEISRRFPVVLKVVSRPNGALLDLPGVRVEWIPWSYGRESVDLNSFDIAINPMVDDHWGKGKCSLKLLQYMAAGLPTVSSRAGMNCDVIEDGVDGFLAGAREEWVEKLSRLIEDESFRKQMGERARGKVVRDYSLEKMARRFSDILCQVGSR